MANLPKEHSSLYFDTLVRTKKAETVLSLIKATYNAYKTKTTDVKNEIAERLKSAYELFKLGANNTGSGAGTYSGSASQFESQYTIGHEMAIWHDSELHLNYESMLVACDLITIKDYFDLVFLNYVQLIDGKVYHPLYGILKYLNDNNTDRIELTAIKTIFDNKCDDEQLRSICNFLISTSYFESVRIQNNSYLKYVNSSMTVYDLMGKCNITYLSDDGYNRIKTELNSSNAYENYIFGRKNCNILFEGKTKDEVNTLFRNWLKSNLNFEPSDGYNGYSSMLFRIFDILENTGIINKDSFRCSDLVSYQVIKELFLENNEAVAADTSQRGNGKAAFPYYVDFIQQILDYGYEEVDRGVSNNLYVSDLNPCEQIVEQSNDSGDKSISYNYNDPSIKSGGVNIIYYGTPGCGKSHLVDLKYNKTNNIVFRTVFHPEYSFTDFVGQIIPKVDEKDREKVYYDFNAGIFTKAFKSAIDNKDKDVILIIEEINRGNAAAIFGEIFQLLDRYSNGLSKFEIDNQYISHEAFGDYTHKIQLPKNLSIIATMNTSDQNVYTLDTAFKRRWDMVKIRNTFDDIDVSPLPEELKYKQKISEMRIPNSDITWREFVEQVNDKISRKDKSFGINSEDKELGVYFVGEKYLCIDAFDKDKEKLNLFGEKVLMYIWNDVARLDPKQWFGDCSTLDAVLKDFEDTSKANSLSVFKTLFGNNPSDFDNQDGDENE